MRNAPETDFAASKAFTRRIEAVVPGGAHTYSKGRDQFPENAPNGITHGKGAHVWDADGNRFVDWSMGLTSVSLGHADDQVNSAVIREIANGVNFQRPAQVELRAAERFVAATGTQMVKFARHGSAVTTGAVKLARAFTGRAKVAVPRQHPFFSFDDWFIGVTDADWGVPEELKQFTLKFDYGDMDSLHALFAEHGDDIACVMMEPVKFDLPPDGYLGEIQDLCRKRKSIFVLDEMITGLKVAFPGAGAYYGVEPDISTWGKGIANGFACSALAGRADILRLGGIDEPGRRKLFLLSSTHGAESVGLAAMMATLDRFADGTVIRRNWEAGASLKARIEATIAARDLGGILRIKGLPCLMLIEPVPSAVPENYLRTLLMQEMIAGGVLFQGMFVPTPSHGADEIDQTCRAFDQACAVIEAAVRDDDVAGRVQGAPVKPVFRKFV